MARLLFPRQSGPHKPHRRISDEILQEMRVSKMLHPMNAQDPDAFSPMPRKNLTETPLAKFFQLLFSCS